MIGSGSLRRFVQGARNAGEGKIIKGGFPKVFDWLHMVDMERSLLACLRKLAVFATIFGSFNDLLPENIWNVAHRGTSFDR